MIEISDKYDTSTQGNFFSSPNKNLGNKMFIYSCSRIMADILDCNLICPPNSIIRRQDQETGLYKEQLFPFGGISNRKNITNQMFVVNDNDIAAAGTLQNLINLKPNSGFFIQTYFSKYDYIKPYKNLVKDYFRNLIYPEKKEDDLIILLRNSNMASNFHLPDSFYTECLEKEKFEKLYVCLDHKTKHEKLLKKLEKYKPIFVEGDILEVFSQITTFKKIIAAQGTFSFWACFLSHAEKIYWPVTNDGPNSNNSVWGKLVNLKVDDEDRYIHINVNNIYE